MPNTLAHIAINIPITRLWIKQSDAKWILLGTIIPDIPWIFQRIIPVFSSRVDLYDLRIYSIIQASLFFSVILSLALAFFSSKVFRTFIILSVGSLIHLVADALERKWANGVHFLAPFDWTIFNIGIFWPENLVVYVLAFIGLLIFIFQFKSPDQIIRFRSPGKKSIFIILFLIIYFALPLLFFNAVIDANNHYVKTLTENPRSGAYVEFDRSFYVDSDKGDYITTFANEKLFTNNIDLSQSVLISIKARFTSNNGIKIYEYYLHTGMVRDKLSILGLALIVLYWSVLFWRGYKKNKRLVK